MNTIAIITNGNYFSSLILEQLLDSDDYDICCAIVVTGDYVGRSGLRALRPLAKVTAFPYLAYKILTMIAFRIAQLLRPRAIYAVADSLRAKSIVTMVVPKINTPEVTAFLKQHSPDLLVSVSCPQRIKGTLLSIPAFGSINIHSSLLPRYAGLAPYYWVLSHGEVTTGVTVHYMTDNFDDGDILVQETLAIPAQTTAFALFRQLSVIGSAALLRAVELALKKYPGTKQTLQARSYYSHPSSESYKQLRKFDHRLWRISDFVHAIANPVNKLHFDREKMKMRESEHVET